MLRWKPRRHDAIEKLEPALLSGGHLLQRPAVGGLDGLIFRLLGSTGGPRVTQIAKAFFVLDRGALREHLDGLARPGIERLVPCHGDIVSQNASQVLRGVAHALG